MTLLSELFPSVGVGVAVGMILGDRIAYTSSTTLNVADHEALAPEGYELFGWRVKAIGAGASGAGANRNEGGWGGSAPDAVVLPKSLFASTVAVGVGAGGASTSDINSRGNAGGASYFGAQVFASGGPVGIGSLPVVPLTPGSAVFFLPSTTDPSKPATWAEGQPGSGASGAVRNGCGSPTGRRGGGGASGNTSSVGVGGAVYPHPNASTGNAAAASPPEQLSWTNSSGVVAYLRGAGNPNVTHGAAGHDGIGDYPGGGGNVAGPGGFPGGGGGSGGSKGGDGVVIVYPIFRKAL